MSRFWLVLLLVGAAPAAAALEVERYPALVELRARLVERHGFSAAQINDWFAGARLRPEIVELMERPKEALPWPEYRKLFVTEERARLGAQFWRTHDATLTRAAETFGVEPEVVVAVIGVETRYGRHSGRFPVLDALTTLTLQYPKRAAFFRGQLEEYLLLARELDIHPLGLKGSYAGAIGVPQFIPSSYRRYAVDFDGDARRDLVGSTEDAIGSVANYLREHGWQRAAPVAEDVSLEGRWQRWLESQAPAAPRSGPLPVTEDEPSHPTGLLVLEGEGAPQLRLVYANFMVIMKYNRSSHYALAVHELAQRLRRLREDGP
jgi:membrane-bound lytic murein transglycosylase B